MRIYMGFRIEGECAVFSWDSSHPARPVRLPPHLELVNHSPTGFEWSYNGSGPAQLAFALAYDALADHQRAFAIHQDLKRDLVCAFNRDCWSITAETLINTIVRLEGEQARRRRENYGKSI